MKKYFPLFILFTMLAAIACTKFKDDPFISLRSPQHRLLGSWKVVAFEVDGADSLSNLFTYAKFANCEFKFEYDKGNSVNKIEGCVDDWLIGWGFNRKHFYIGEYFIYPRIIRYPNGDFYIAPIETIYNVLKLYNKDFWIQKTFMNKTYTIKFKKQ